MNWWDNHILECMNKPSKEIELLHVEMFCEIFLVVSRLDSGESIEENKKNLMLITQKVFDSIVGSAPQ